MRLRNFDWIQELYLKEQSEKKDYYSKTRKFNTPRNKMHPTQKPIEYLKGLIELNTKKNDIVLDSFFGSGETGMACLQLDRKIIGIEIDEKYYNLSKKRLDCFVNQKTLFNK